MSKTINKKLAVAIALIAAVFMFTSVQSAYAADTVGQLDKPTLKLSLSEPKAFSATTKNDIDAMGYQIKYSRNSNFSSAKSVYVKGSKLNKKISKLTLNKKYYVKVRAYKTVDGKKTYGPWSSKKYITVRSYYYAYTKNTETRIYEKETASSNYEKIWYNTKLKIVGKDVKAKGLWYKVKYNGKTYYLWEDNGISKLNTVENKYDDYTGPANTDDQNAVLDKALYIMNNWDTKYVLNGYNEVVDGKHQFDCSGFVTYVYNETIGVTHPGFFLPHKASKLYDLNETGLGSVVKVYERPDKDTLFKSSDYSKLKPGDIVLFKTGDSTKINHCAIYLGGKEFIHCNERGVHILSFEGSYYKFIDTVIRVIPE